MTPDDRRGRRPHDDADLEPWAIHLKYLREDVDNCVTREEFAPVKTLVYGLMTIVMTSLIGGLITGFLLWKR